MNDAQQDALIQALQAIQAALPAAGAAPQPVVQPRGLSVKLKPFSSGLSEHWQMWKQRFQQEKLLLNWPDDVAKRQLYGSMAEPALNAVSGLNPSVGNADVDVLTFVQYMTRFDQAFLPEHDPADARRQFAAAHCQDGETLLAWKGRLQTLFRRAHQGLDEETSAIIIEKFAAGLPDLDVRAYVELSSPATLTQAITFARRKAHVQDNRARAEGKPVKSESGLGSISALTHAKRREFYGAKSSYSSAGSAGPRQPRAATAADLCWNCGRAGHFQQNCRRPRRQAASGSRFSRAGSRPAGRRRLVINTSRGARPLRSKPGRFGKWRPITVPRKRFYRKLPRGQSYNPGHVYAIEDDTSDGEYEVFSLAGVADPDEVVDRYYLEDDVDSEEFAAAMEEMTATPEYECTEDEALCVIQGNEAT